MTVSASQTILVVEDEAAIRDMLSFTLHRASRDLVPCSRDHGLLADFSLSNHSAIAGNETVGA